MRLRLQLGPRGVAGLSPVLCLFALTVPPNAAGADAATRAGVQHYGALGDGSGQVATEPWLKEKGYPIAAARPDHTVIGIAYGGKSDDPRIKAPKDGDRWYSCEWSPDKFWHYLFGIAEYQANEKKWQKVALKPGQTVYVARENAYYVAVGKSRCRLRRAYVPGWTPGTMSASRKQPTPIRLAGSTYPEDTTS